MAQFTPFAGLFQLDPNDDFSLEDYLYFENEEISDAYFNAFVTHRHNGAPAVQQFASAAVLTTQASGGTLSGGVEWFIGITAVDEFGGETVATASSITTIGGTADPTIAPTVVAATGGTLQLGTYRYGYTYLDGGGETLLSPTTNVTMPFNGQSQITIPSGGLDWRLYRAFGAGPFKRLASGVAAASAYVDDGSVSPDCDQFPPDENTTQSTNKIQVCRPAMPSGAVSWRVYASEFDFFPSPSQWSYASGSVIDVPSASACIDFTSEVEILAGTPPPVNRTIPGASLIYAVDVIYNGGPSLPSGSVEEALDSLASAVGGGPGVSSLAASGEVGMIGDLVLVGGDGISLSQASAASAITIDGSEFRNGTESYKSGQFTVNFNNDGTRKGTKIDITSGFITSEGQRFTVSNSDPTYDEARDHHVLPNAGSGVIVAETNTSGNKYEVTHAIDPVWLAASGVVASAGFASAAATAASASTVASGAAVTSITPSGGTAVTGAVTFSADENIGLEQTGQNIEFRYRQTIEQPPASGALDGFQMQNKSHMQLFEIASAGASATVNLPSGATVEHGTEVEVKVVNAISTGDPSFLYIYSGGEFMENASGSTNIWIQDSFESLRFLRDNTFFSGTGGWHLH